MKQNGKKISMMFVLLISLVFVAAVVAGAVIRLSLDAEKGTVVGDYPVVLSINDPVGVEVNPWGANAIVGELYSAVLKIDSNGSYEANIIIEVTGVELSLVETDVFISLYLDGIEGDSTPVSWELVDGQLVGSVPILIPNGLTEIPVEVVFNMVGEYKTVFWVSEATV